MEKLIFLTLFLLTGLSAEVAAQCYTKQARSNPEVFQQDPAAKAALIAAADETISVYTDAAGNPYYVREYTNPWNGEAGYHLLEFDPAVERFVERQDYAFHGGQKDDDEDRKTPECDKVKQDSVRTPDGKLVPVTPPVKQPRRSSRVKLAAADL